jgi:hypothetical protein
VAKPGLFIDTQGAGEDPERQERPARSLRGPKAGRVVRALVAARRPPGVRELAAAIKIDAGYVSRVLAFLDNEALITRVGAGASKASTGQGYCAAGPRTLRSSRGGGFAPTSSRADFPRCWLGSPSLARDTPSRARSPPIALLRWPPRASHRSGSVTPRQPRGALSSALLMQARTSCSWSPWTRASSRVLRRVPGSGTQRRSKLPSTS